MRGVLFASLILLFGCYKYVPVSVGEYEQIQQGRELRTQFIEEESFDLFDVTVHNIVAIDAEFVRLDRSTMIMSAFWLDSSIRDVGFAGDGWTVRIPISNISQMSIKEFDWWRTGAVLAGGFIASYLGWKGMQGALGDGGEISPGEGGVSH